MNASSHAYHLEILHALAEADRFEKEGGGGAIMGSAVISIGVKPKLGVGRNEKCPCGSGKKFKRCCKDQ